MTRIKYLRKLSGISEKSEAPTSVKRALPKATSSLPQVDEGTQLQKLEQMLTMAVAAVPAEDLSIERMQVLAGITEGKRPRAGEWLPPPEGGMHSAPLGTIKHLAGSYKGGEKKHAYIKASHDGWRGWKYLGRAERHPEHTPKQESEMAPDVAQHFVGKGGRFLELAGLTEGPSVAYGKGWELPEWANGNERLNEPGPEGWKQAVVKLAPTPEKTHQYNAETGKNDAYMSLGQALSKLKLPTSTGESRQVDPQEFVYRGQHIDETGKTSWVHFKHRDTRNNVHLDLQGLKLVIPKSDEPFHRGEFDKVEHSDVYTRLRSLAGIK